MAVIIDQKIFAGGGYQQSLNAAFSTLKLNKDLVDVVFYTLTKSNVKVFRSHNINIKYIKFSFLIKLIALIKVKPKFKILSLFFEFISFFNLFEFQLISDGIDLVYFLSPSYLPISLNKLNFIYTVWDLCHRDHPEFPEVRENSEFEMREYTFKSFLPKAIAIIADSQEGKNNIIRRYNIDYSRIKVIPFKPSFEIMQYKKITKDKILKNKFSLDKTYIFYPAQYWPHKNHVYIINAINEIKTKYNLPIYAKFTGSDKGNLEYLKAYTKALKIDNRIKFYGFVSNIELIALYKNSLALVMPSYFGPTNIPPLEAFWLDVPLIYPSDKSFKEQIGNAALFMDLENHNTLVENIIKLYENKRLVKDLIKKGKKQLEIISKTNETEILEIILTGFANKRINWN